MRTTEDQTLIDAFVERNNEQTRKIGKVKGFLYRYFSDHREDEDWDDMVVRLLEPHADRDAGTGMIECDPPN